LEIPSKVDNDFLGFFGRSSGFKFAIEVPPMFLTASTISSPLLISYPRRTCFLMACAIYYPEFNNQYIMDILI
jgi:hypothetical protein